VKKILAAIDQTVESFLLSAAKSKRIKTAGVKVDLLRWFFLRSIC